jgi:hypothetical protein
MNALGSVDTRNLGHGQAGFLGEPPVDLVPLLTVVPLGFFEDALQPAHEGFDLLVHRGSALQIGVAARDRFGRKIGEEFLGTFLLPEDPVISAAAGTDFHPAPACDLSPFVGDSDLRFADVEDPQQGVHLADLVGRIAHGPEGRSSGQGDQGPQVRVPLDCEF